MLVGVPRFLLPGLPSLARLRYNGPGRWWLTGKWRTVLGHWKLWEGTIVEGELGWEQKKAELEERLRRAVGRSGDDARDALLLPSRTPRVRPEGSGPATYTYAIFTAGTYAQFMALGGPP